MADATTAQLLGLLAHDLRNPLSALHSNVGYLASILESAEEDVVEALADARVSCESLVRIIDNLELLGRDLGDAPELGRTRIDWVSMIETVIGQMSSLAESYGVTVQFEPPSRPASVEANRDMASRAFANLLNNAIQHGQPGKSVRVECFAEERVEGVRVVDSGAVLEPELRERAFEAAGQNELKSAPAGRYGRGLGLFAARIASVAAGGSARASVTGDQNAFELRMPRSAD